MVDGLVRSAVERECNSPVRGRVAACASTGVKESGISAYREGVLRDRPCDQFERMMGLRGGRACPTGGSLQVLHRRLARQARNLRKGRSTTTGVGGT